jgi:two-component SAPR family response regulator
MQLAQVAMQQNQPAETSAHLHTAFQLARDAGLIQPLCVESLNRMQVLRFAVKQGHKTDELDRWMAAARELERVRKDLARTPALPANDKIQPELSIHALGASSVIIDGETVSWRTTQAKELFFYLLTHPSGQTKEQIGLALWPDHSQAKLFSIFRSSLFRVRKATFSELIQFKDDQYALNPEISFAYDVADFESETSKGDLANTAVQRAYHYRRAVDLYKGMFLEDLYVDWVTSIREGLQNQYLQALTFLAKFNLERARYPRAIDFARRIIAVDEYYEIAYYLLIQAYAKSGQRPQAKRIYAQCRDMLAGFGLSPQKRWEELCS